MSSSGGTVTAGTCAKLCVITFAAGVAVGFALNKKVRSSRRALSAQVRALGIEYARPARTHRHVCPQPHVQVRRSIARWLGEL
jgi:hypothetical protein